VGVVSRSATRSMRMEIARERLRNQRIDGAPLKRPVDAVRWLVASQAQDYAGAKWALGLRTSGANDAAVERAFDDGAILRTHLMRPTWHFVTQEDIRWLLALTAPRVNALNAYQCRKLGLDGATLRKSTAILTRALEGGRELTRDELREHLSRARLGTEEQRMAYMLMHAELDAAICSGARRGKQFTYALFDERAPRARVLSREAALAELADRYFVSRGPAKVQDFAKWSGLTVADAQRGLEAAAPKLRQRMIEGATYWSRGVLPVGPSPARAHLLSIYDEYISSYRDRSAMGDPADAKKLVGMGNALAYVLIVDGRIAGTWRRSLSRKAVHLEVTPFRKLRRMDENAVLAAATRYVRFVGEDHALDLKFT
jgi:hypothetical protein